MKKMLSALLACILSLSLLPAGALAEGETAGDTVSTAPSTATAPFADVSTDAWYYSAVQYALKNSIMSGVSDDYFSPDTPMTRAMLSTVIYRLDGSNKCDKTTDFSDVGASAWYYDAVEWAAANGIVTGYGNGILGADDNVTRQQAAVMLQRYAKFKGRVVDVNADLTAFPDASDIADWASAAMEWAVSGGLINGGDNSALTPNGSATRAEMAAILMRYINASALEKRSADYVSQFVKGDFTGFYEDCDEQMQQSVTKDKLVQGWNNIIQAAGNAGDSLGTLYVKQNGYDVTLSAVSGTLSNIKITITYDANGNPAGLWTNLTPKDPPKPQSTDKWEEVPTSVGEKSLPGMLTLPKGVQNPPVVILIQGSGSSNMNESLGTAPNSPFEDIAHGLAEQGVATLRYNKRTYEYPTGGDPSIEYEMLDDAAAAVKLLSSDKRVDANRIYLLGHSLGGMMAPKMTADNPQIKGFISMAGSLRTFQDISMDQNTASINSSSSLTEQQKTDYLTQVKTALDKTKTLDDGGTGAIMGIPTTYWKSLNDIDNLSIVKSLTVPMLILQGSADFQVYPDKDYKLWQTTLAGRSNVTFKLYDGLSHLFMPNQVSTSGVPDITLYNAPNHVSQQVINDITTWVNGQ